MTNAFVIGAGGWGTALAIHFARCGMPVRLWGHDAAHIADLRRTHENALYLSGVRMPDAILPVEDFEGLAEADLAAFVPPSRAMREVALRAAAESRVAPHALVVSGSKGIEAGTGARMTRILSEIFPRHPIGALSGPTHAEEVARGIPSAVVFACTEQAGAERFQERVGNAFLRIYTATDVAGVEYGGALKNVYAIAAGIGDGLGLGDNAKAALVTRSLAELARLGAALGGRPETFYGLSGLGDLMVTCFSGHSRNRRFGEAVGSGRPPADVLEDSPMVVEGVPATRNFFGEARAAGIEAPVLEQVHGILFENRDPRQAVSELMHRAPKPETAPDAI